MIRPRRSPVEPREAFDVRSIEADRMFTEAATGSGGVRHIVDFQLGQDKIDVHHLLLGYAGADPQADGYLLQRQNSLGGTDNFYIYSDLGIGVPGTPISVTGHVGYTDGFLTFTLDGNEERAPAPA